MTDLPTVVRGLPGEPSNRGCPLGTTPPPSPVNVVVTLPPNTPPKSPDSQDLSKLRVPEAKSAARRALEQKYGTRFKKRSSRGYRLTCRLLTDHRAACKVAWRYRRSRYSGTLKVAGTENDSTSLRESRLEGARRRWSPEGSLSPLVV